MKLLINILFKKLN